MLPVRHSNSPHYKCSTENFGKQYVILSFSFLVYIYIWMCTCRRDWHSLPSVQPRILLSGFILSKVICDSFLTIKKYYDNSMNTG
jgi:hypothetical protein